MSEFDFSDLIRNVQNNDFEEVPVLPEEFLYGEEYLDLTDGGTRDISLSENQMLLIRAGSQIFREDTLHQIYDTETAAARWKDTKQEVLMVLGKGCHAPQTPVFDAETGRWERLDSFVNPDNKVMSVDGAEYATESFKVGFGEMVRVTTQLGLVEDVYVGHDYLGYKRNRFYKRNERGYLPERLTAQDISPGDVIASRLNFEPVKTISIGEDEAWVLGLWIGDGCLPQKYRSHTGYSASIDFGSIEQESFEKYLGIIGSWGDEETSVVYHENKAMVTVHHSRKRSPRLFDLFDRAELIGKSAGTKTIPDIIWSCPNNEISQFASGMWSSDGCIYEQNVGRKKVCAEWRSISKDLADGFQKLLLRIGVPASIRSKIPTYTYKGKKRRGQRAYILDVGGDDRLTAFIRNVPLFDHKARVADAYVSPSVGRPYRRIEGDIYWNRVKSVESIGDGDYWTISVPETKQYVGNGLISFNSGKDYCSTLICAYVVYQLMCLKDPSRYFGKPADNTFDIINIAINAQQANNVFFKNFVSIIRNAPWFRGKYDPKVSQVDFDKNVRVYSGHSEKEAYEGYNVILAILDEIDGFPVPGPNAREDAKSADGIYDMYKMSVLSRFPDAGKVLMLSFPRTKTGFIMRKYDDLVATKETIIRTETLLINPEFPDVESNQMVIEWEEDHVTSYTLPGVFCLKRPTWEVNPTKKISDFIPAFIIDYQAALGKFACMPPESLEGLFRDEEKVKSAFSSYNGVDNVTGVFEEWFKQDGEHQYYVHVDLAQKHDRCVVSMSHVEKWEKRAMGGGNSAVLPVVRVDAIRYWTPTKEKNVDFGEVRDYIVSLRQRGFNVRLVTFDQYRSEDMMKYLKSIGIKSEKLSVQLGQYTDLVTVVQDDRLRGPDIPILHKELMQLRLLPNGKVDHPNTRSGSNDLADSVAGSVHNALKYSRRPVDGDVEIRTDYDILKPIVVGERPKAPTGVIMPPNLKDWADGLSML